MIVKTGQISTLKRGPSVFGVVGATGTPARGDLLRTSTERVCGGEMAPPLRFCSAAAALRVPWRRVPSVAFERSQRPATQRGRSLLPSKDVTMVIPHSRAPSHSTRPFAEPCSPRVTSADLQHTPVCTKLSSRLTAGLVARSLWVSYHAYALVRLKPGAPYRDWG